MPININRIPLSRLENKVIPISEAGAGSLLQIADGGEQVLALRIGSKTDAWKGIVFLEGKSAWMIRPDVGQPIWYAIDLSDFCHLVLRDLALREIPDRESPIEWGDVIVGQAGHTVGALLLAAKVKRHSKQPPQTVYIRLNGPERCEQVIMDPFPAICIGKAAVAPRKMSDRLAAWLSRTE